MRRLLALALGVVLAAVTPASARKAATLVIAGATIIDVRGGPPIRDGVVVIEGERIKRVGPRSRTPIPDGARVLDATGKYLIPGLADMHNHLGPGHFGLGHATAPLRDSLGDLLAWGVTLTFAPGTPSLDEFAELKRVSSAPGAPYPRFYGTGRWFGAKGGHAGDGFTPETPEEARRAVRQLKAARVDAVKVVYSDVTYALRAGLPKLDRTVMEAIVDEAHRRGLKVYVHAPILRYAKEALRAGADGLAHGVISDPIDDELIALMKRNRAVYMTTHSIFEAASDLAGWARREAAFDRKGFVPPSEFATGTDPAFVSQWESRWDNFAHMRAQLPVLRANTKRAFDAGILVVAGSDTGDSGAGLLIGLATQVELALLVESGLSAAEVLRVATLNGARMLGLERDLGTIEAGKLADMVVLDADPLADIRNVNAIYRVVKGGGVYDPADVLRRPR